MLLEGRFNLGVGSGEALNEHILGDRWPEADVRLEMLEEAVEVIRTLWQGGQRSHHGRHYTVENARIYDLPDEPPPVLVSGFGPKAIELAARIGDGFCTTSPDKEAIELYRSEGGNGPGARRHQGLLHGRRGRGARDRAPAVAQRGAAGRAGAGPAHARALRAGLRARRARACSSRRVGPDLDAHVESLRQYADAGVDELFVQQIGPEQDAFFDAVGARGPAAVRARGAPMKVVVTGATGNVGHERSLARARETARSRRSWGSPAAPAGIGEPRVRFVTADVAA